MVKISSLSVRKFNSIFPYFLVRVALTLSLTLPSASQILAELLCSIAERETIANIANFMLLFIYVTFGIQKNSSGLERYHRSSLVELDAE